LVEAERLAAALAEPAPRAPLSAPEPTLAPWRPHAVDEAAVEGAAASMGGSIDDLEAAIRDGSVSWETRIREPRFWMRSRCVAPGDRRRPRMTRALLVAHRGIRRRPSCQPCSSESPTWSSRH